MLPKSLVGQLLVLVALMLLIAQGINMVLLYRGAQNQNLIESSTGAVARIAGEMHRLDRPDFERNQRERRRARNEQRRGFGSFRRAKPSVSENPLVTAEMNRLPELERRAVQAFDAMGFTVRAVQAALVKERPAGFESSVIGMRRPRRFADPTGRALGQRRERPEITGYVLVSAELSNGRWMNIASAVRDRESALMRTLVFQTAVLYLILLLPLILLGRYISRPLKELTQSAEKFDPGDSDKVEERGPPDVRKLIEAYNAMKTRVGAMLDEKDVMLGAIGHDLRTPLAALRVRVESVEDETERARMVAGIEDMDRTLDDILSLARLGRSGEQAEPTDINALIETVVGEFADLAEDVSFERASRVTAPVRATLIRRGLRNLISNAVKYGKKAIISVDKTADSLVINVDDEGPGIESDQIDAMFEPFARAEKSRNRATGGSGLGLTLARAIARDHGGDVALQNREQGGLRAAIILPLS